MEHPVRIILKKIKTDSNGQLIDAGYKTVDIDNRQLESLLYESKPHLHGQYYVVGAELLNKAKLIEEESENERKDREFLDF